MRYSLKVILHDETQRGAKVSEFILIIQLDGNNGCLR